MLKYKPLFLGSEYTSSNWKWDRVYFDNSREEILKERDKIEEAGDKILKTIKQINPELRAYHKGKVSVYNSGFILEYDINTRHSSFKNFLIPRTIARLTVDTGNCSWDENTIEVSKMIRDNRLEQLAFELEKDKKFKFIAYSPISD